MRVPPVVAALGAGSAACLLYLVTLSDHPTADSRLFAQAIESSELRRLINLRHPLLHPLGWAFVAIWRALGWDGGALLPLQVLNALGGGAMVAILYWLAARLTISPIDAALASAGFAVSGATWLLSTQAEFVTVPLAAALAVLAVMVTAPPDAWRRHSFVLAIGAAIGMAMLAYLSNAALAAVAIAAAYPRQPGAVPVWTRRIAMLAAGALLILVPALVGLSLLRHDAPPLAAMVGRHAGFGYFTPAISDLGHGAYAFARSLLLFPGLGMNDSTGAFLSGAGTLARLQFAAYYLPAGALAAAVPLAALRRRAALSAAYGRPLAQLLLWAALHTAFALVWVVGDISFWLPPLAAWWLLAALLLASSPSPPRKVMAVVIIALLLANGRALIPAP